MHITKEELQHTILHHFKDNKSSGLSDLPLQALRHLGGDALGSLTKFLNTSAIDQLAPVTWRKTKVVPLYKGKGDQLDFNNYRSIAVTPPFTKLLMSVIN